MRCLVSGNCGFVGSYLADYLIKKSHHVTGIDNLLTGDMRNVNKKVEFHEADIRHESVNIYFKNIDWVFHLAANCRTFLSVADPMMDMENNIKGTLNILLAARDNKVKRFVFASSCILNSPNTPYYVSKLAGEEYCKVFNKLYGLSTIALRYSNVYGSLRQSEKGSHINALASLHHTKKLTGRIWITGNGEQKRQWTHVDDICRANLLAAESKHNGVLDICTGVNTSMNEIAKYFKCPIDYVPKARGDHMNLSDNQDPIPAKNLLGYEYKIPLSYESLKPYL
mgnify:CR=1 FL=1